MSKDGKSSQISKWLGIAAGTIMFVLAGIASPYYFGPPSQTASVLLVDSMGPSAPQGLTVTYNKSLNRMELTWSALQNSDERNYAGYPANNLHPTEPYVVLMRVDDGVDGTGLPVWTTVYSGDQASLNYNVTYGHKYVFRAAGKDEAPYENIGEYLASDEDPNNDIFSAPEIIDGLDTMPTDDNSSALLTWDVPQTQSASLNYNIYLKYQSVPLVQGDLIPTNLSYTVSSTSWNTYGGRSYQYFEHFPPTGLITGGAYVDIAYAVCAVDTEGHESDISRGDGNRVLNGGFESGSLYWLIDPPDVGFISIAQNLPLSPRPVHSGSWSASTNAGIVGAPPWDELDLKVAAVGWPKAYAGKNVTVKAWVNRISGYPLIQLYSYDKTGAELYLGYEYFDTIGSGWQQISFTAPTVATDVHYTETVQARFLANTACYFDDIEIMLAASENTTVARISDTSAPATISTLDTYGKYSINDIYVEWDNPPDNIGVDRYRVYRNSFGQGPLVPTNLVTAEMIDIAITELSPPTAAAGTTVTWVNTDPWPGYVYYYGVAALDVADNESIVSNSTQAMSGYPYDDIPPMAVTIIEVTFQKSASPPFPPHKIYLEWLAVTDVDNRGDPGQIKYYHLYRQQSNPITSIAGLSPISDVAATVWHEDEDVTENTTYYYAVTARDISMYPNSGGNEGGFVNSMGVATDTMAPQFDTSYIAENDFWCALPGNGSTTSVKNNGTQNKYSNGDTIDIEIDLGETGLQPYITANFFAVDNFGFSTNVIDNGNGTYRITHYMDPGNTRVDNNLSSCGEVGYYIVIQASDQYFNGPSYDSTFDVELDNTAPKAP